MWLTILVVVLIAVGLAYELGRRSADTSRADPPTDLQSSKWKREHLTKAEHQWAAILAQDRDLTPEEQTRYRSFVTLRRAALKAERDGRNGDWTQKDVIEAGDQRKADRLTAIDIGKRIDAASEEWAKQGYSDPPPVRILGMYEEWDRLMGKMGEINALRASRQDPCRAKILNRLTIDNRE